MKEMDLIIDTINSSNDFQMLIDTLYNDKLDIKSKKYILYNVDDNIKFNVLNLALDSLYKKLIVSSFHSDKDKITYLYLLDDYDKFEIISRFINDEDKISSIKFINDSYWKDLILYSLKDEDLRKRSVSLIESDIIKSNLLNEIDIESRLSNLVYVRDVNAKRDVILETIKEKDLKRIFDLNDEYLNILSSVYDVSKSSLKKLINTFSSEIILYLDNELKGILKYTEEELDKFLNIFDKVNLKIGKDEIENICFLIEYYRYELNSKDVYNEFLNYLENNDNKKFLEEYNKVLEFLNTEEIYKIIKYNELKLDDIKYLTYNLFNKNDYLRNLNILRIIINIYNDKNRSEYIQKNIEKIESNVKDINDVDIKDILDIVININYDEIQKNILSKEDVYNKLVKVLYKYKYLALVGDISKLFELVNLNFNSNVKKNIIEKFYDYYPYLEYNKDDNEFINIIYMVNGYEENNYRKYLLLGKNNYFKIKKRSVSLEEINDNIVSLYNKKYCLVPSFSFSDTVNDIDIDIVVGKYFDKVNYLDRFNEDEFCILFKDVKESITLGKVKGFMKNSSIFLGEIEILVKSKLSKNDFIYLCKKASEKILSLADDNIESIFISVYNYVNTNKQFLYYMDSKYVLLNGKSLLTIKSNDEYKKYDVIRSKIELYKGVDASQKEYEYKLINSIINGSNRDISFDEEILYLYCGEDWYIKRNSDYKLVVFVFDASRGNKKAIEEKNICLEVLKNEN